MYTLAVAHLRRPTAVYLTSPGTACDANGELSQ